MHYNECHTISNTGVDFWPLSDVAAPSNLDSVWDFNHHTCWTPPMTSLTIETDITVQHSEVIRSLCNYGWKTWVRVRKTELFLQCWASSISPVIRRHLVAIPWLHLRSPWFNVKCWGTHMMVNTHYVPSCVLPVEMRLWVMHFVLPVWCHWMHTMDFVKLHTPAWLWRNLNRSNGVEKWKVIQKM